MSEFVIAQVVGFIAVAISLSIFQVNKRSKMLILSTIAALLYSVHFFMLGAATGGMMNLLGGIRSYVFFRVKPTKSHRWILIAFIIAAIIGTVITWQGLISLLAMSGSISLAFANWQKKPKYIRRWSLIANPLWFTYNAFSKSYPGMLIEVIMLISNLVGQYRFDIHRDRRRLAKPA